MTDPLLLAPGFGKLAFKLQGHTHFAGLPIAIENRKGSVREGVDKDGKPWRTKFKIPYGYLKNTEGRDGEEIDVYLGPDRKSDKVFVVHQHHITGKGHDEDKCLLGLNSIEEAKRVYLEHYNKVGPKLLGKIDEVSLQELKSFLIKKDGKRVDKITPQVIAKEATHHALEKLSSQNCLTHLLPSLSRITATLLGT